MEKKTVKVPVYETKKVQTGENDKTIYIALDGKEFSHDNECIAYEKELQVISDANECITEVNLGDAQESVSALIFGGFNVSCAQFYKWTATKDKHVIDRVCAYLAVKHCSIYKSDLGKFEEGDKVLISSWTECENSDYPSYEAKAIKYDDAIKIIDDLSDKMKSVFNS